MGILISFQANKKKQPSLWVQIVLYIFASEDFLKTVEIQEYEEDEGKFHGVDLDIHELEPIDLIEF